LNEATLMRRIMLAVAKTTVLFRNQSGAYKAGEQWIRYGLGNPGGSDLIGWTSIEVTPDMVGKKVAILTALEVKTATGRATKEQEAFISAVQRAGGLAGIVRSEEDAAKVVANISTAG
jgi:hypothetical protein